MDDHGTSGGGLDAFALAKLAALEAAGLRRSLIETDRTDTVEVMRDGRTLISFCCNDYLNLSHHPEVKRAARDVVERLGTGAGASRLVTGNHSLLGELETKLATLKGTESWKRNALIEAGGWVTMPGAKTPVAGAADLCAQRLTAS